MHITVHLIAGLPGQAETSAFVSGEVITVDGVAFDLSGIPEGGVAEPEGDHPFLGQIARISGELHLALRWFYSTGSADPHQPAIPPVLLVTDGSLPDPVLRLPMEEEA